MHYLTMLNSLYRLPNLTLSRDKVANFKDECDFKITRDRNKADICVIGKKTITRIEIAIHILLQSTIVKR